MILILLQNPSKDDSSEIIETAEIVSLDKTANETYEADPPVVEFNQVERGEQDQVSKAVQTEQVSEENKILAEEVKHVNETYEESTNLEMNTYSEEKRLIEGLKESLEEEEKERAVDLNEIQGKEPPEEKVRTTQM